MTVSVVIPAYNEETYIGACLKSVIANRGPDFLEIIVVDNASTDRTGEIAKSFPGVTVVREPAKGLTKARQCGLMAAKGDLVAYIDADTQMPPGWGAIVQQEFAKDKNLVCLSGPFRYYDMPAFRKFLTELLWNLMVPLVYRLVGFMVLGANFVAKREALMKIGGFDTTIEFYGEDTDIARRLSKVGKVKFKIGFFIMGSGRRLMQQGLVKTFWIYAINYLWGAFKKQPYTKAYKDFR